MSKAKLKYIKVNYKINIDQSKERATSRMQKLRNEYRNFLDKERNRSSIQSHNIQPIQSWEDYNNNANIKLSNIKKSENENCKLFFFI